MSDLRAGADGHLRWLDACILRFRCLRIIDILILQHSRPSGPSVRTACCCGAYGLLGIFIRCHEQKYGFQRRWCGSRLHGGPSPDQVSVLWLLKVTSIQCNSSLRATWKTSTNLLLPIKGSHTLVPELDKIKFFDSVGEKEYVNNKVITSEKVHNVALKILVSKLSPLRVVIGCLCLPPKLSGITLVEFSSVCYNENHQGRICSYI